MTSSRTATWKSEIGTAVTEIVQGFETNDLALTLLLLQRVTFWRSTPLSFNLKSALMGPRQAKGCIADYLPIRRSSFWPLSLCGIDKYRMADPATPAEHLIAFCTY